jgi:hypothetical protein
VEGGQAVDYSCGDYDLRMCGPDDATNVARFILGFRDGFAQTPQAFFNLPDDELTAPGSRFATISYRGQLVAGARAVLDGTPSVHCGQCYTDSQHRRRGLIGVCIAGLRVDFYRKHGVSDADLVVRIIGGVANPSVVRAYARVGFIEGDVIRQAIDPNDPVSRHLLETADPGGILSVRKMTATGDSLASNRALLRSFGWGDQ